MPVSASRPSDRPAIAGVAAYRVSPRKYAEMKKDAALIANAMFRPATAVTRPPIEAPAASIADHVAAESALAGSSSSSDVMLGMVAVRAGSKNADALTVNAITT